MYKKITYNYHYYVWMEKKQLHTATLEHCLYYNTDNRIITMISQFTTKILYTTLTIHTYCVSSVSRLLYFQFLKESIFWFLPISVRPWTSCRHHSFQFQLQKHKNKNCYKFLKGYTSFTFFNLSVTGSYYPHISIFWHLSYMLYMKSRD